MGAKTMQEKVQSLFEHGFIADVHCDTLLDLCDGKRRFLNRNTTGHIDLPRLEDGRVALQFFAAFIGSEYKPERALKRTLQLIDTFYREVITPETGFVLGTHFKQINRVLKRRINKVAILAIEGGEALAGDLSVLHILYRLGVRAIGLTWNQRNDIADGVWEDDSGGGLTRFGKKVIAEMNKLGMIIDLSHISERGFWDVIKVSEKPVLVSHANCRALCNHPRNLSNEQIKAIASQGGVVGLTFAPEFLGNPMDIETFIAHVDHMAALVGTDHIVIGSDFDGIEGTPKGLEDITKIPDLAIALLDRGYTVEEAKDIMGNNVLSYLKKVL